jgi:hypothetical protein
MNESVILDVGIGLVLVFVVFSVVTSKLNEMVVGLLNYRGKQLEAALVRLAGGPTHGQPIVNTLLQGPLQGLTSAKPEPKLADKAKADSGPTVLRARRLGLPAYMSGTELANAVLNLLDAPAEVAFAQIDRAGLPESAQGPYDAAAKGLTVATVAALHDAVLVAIAKSPADADPTAQEALAAQRALVDDVVTAYGKDPLVGATEYVDRLPPSALRTKLLGIVSHVVTDRDQFVKELSTWFDSSMDRLSGWYKRRVKIWLALFAIVITVGLNVDTIAITQTLWQTPTVRAAAVAAAQNEQAPGTSNGISDAAKSASDAVRSAESLQIPLGWALPKKNQWEVWDWKIPARPHWHWWSTVLGWLLTVFALSFGAPFWFDVLGKFVNMRSSGPKPASSTQGST